jgi:hypothetical protein
VTDFPIKASEFWSLGRFKPRKLDRFDVGRTERAFRDFVDDRVTNTMSWGMGGASWWMGSSAQYEIRTPSWWANAPGEVAKWHRDGVPDGKPGKAYLILWSTTAPTEIARRVPYQHDPSRLSGSVGPDPTIYQAEPYEVVAFSNATLMHRTPQEITDEEMDQRWFARAHARDTGRVADRRGVYAYEFT